MSQPPASPPPFPQEPPGPPPYYPPPPGPPAEQWGERPKTLGVLALVFGAAALLFGLIPVAGIFIGGLFGVAAIVLGILGIFKSHKLMSIIGIALAVVGLIVTVIVTIAVGKAAEDIIEDWPTDYETSDDGEDSDQGHGDAPQDQVVDGTDPTAPLPAGSEVTTGNWTVVISEVVPDATDQVMGRPPVRGLHRGQRLHRGLRVHPRPPLVRPRGVRGRHRHRRLLHHRAERGSGDRRDRRRGLLVLSPALVRGR
jgi:hypothetical protein